MIVKIDLKGGGTVSGPHEVYSARQLIQTALAQE